MNFTSLKLHLDQYLSNDFDLETLSEPTVSPFVFLIHLKTNGKFASQTYGQYITKPGQRILHDNTTIHNLSATCIMMCTFLLQDPDNVEPLEEEYGYCDGFTTNEGEVILCAVISNFDDAKWVCQTVLSQLRIFVENSQVR
jgi:hypothetical protein